MATVAERQVGTFKPQEFANLAWAFATAGHSDEKLLATLARSAERWVGELNEQPLSSVAWVFDTLEHRGKGILASRDIGDCDGALAGRVQQT